MKTVFVTGGAGFIGSAFVRACVRQGSYRVINIDKLTYAGNLDSLSAVEGSDRYAFEHIDINNADALRSLFARYNPSGVVHLAAESHVDRSIDGPATFVATNVVGTFVLLQESLHYWRGLDTTGRRDFRFLHVSTDEVFGSLGDSGYFTEETAYAPNSPYSATKASADHLVRAWHHTYGLPTLTTNCSNNFGPYQFPEKLIPLMILNAVDGRPLPVYGRGDNVRDWLFVDDHVRALLLALESGRPGEVYVIGGGNERTNLQVVDSICDAVSALKPDPNLGDRRQLIHFVPDRPGHDQRYAIDASKIRTELGWQPLESFESGLRHTVAWYLANMSWCERVRSGAYRGERLGLVEMAPA